MSQRDWTADDPFEVCRFSAVHLELRDVYGVPGEAERFALFQQTGRRDPALDQVARAGWMTTVRDMVARGVVVRRARVVSEPVSDYVRFEHAGTEDNLNAGELVRWLPRRQAADLMLPATDLWMWDNVAVQFTFFSGDGQVVDREWRTDAKTLDAVGAAFEAVWARAISHEQYKLT
jgi:hypothetical protein